VMRRLATQHPVPLAPQERDVERSRVV
jgi:hypothetical protein